MVSNPSDVDDGRQLAAQRFGKISTLSKTMTVRSANCKKTVLIHSILSA